MGGGDDSSNDATNQQIQQNEQELNLKKQNLYNTQLSIIKSQGAETWTADRNSGVPNKTSSNTWFNR